MNRHLIIYVLLGVLLLAGCAAPLPKTLPEPETYEYELVFLMTKLGNEIITKVFNEYGEKGWGVSDMFLVAEGSGLFIVFERKGSNGQRHE
jgi:hypothetical protein